MDIFLILSNIINLLLYVKLIYSRLEWVIINSFNKKVVVWFSKLNSKCIVYFWNENITILIYNRKGKFWEIIRLYYF